MKRIEGRESAYVTSKVVDLSRIDNRPDFCGLFSCVTPFGPTPDSLGEYNPVLIRSVEELDATFGDPRIDPERYIDLYSIRELVKSGFACYINKVKSGSPSVHAITLPTSKLTQNASGDATGELDSKTTEEFIVPEDKTIIIDGVCDLPEDFISLDDTNAPPLVMYPVDSSSSINLESTESAVFSFEGGSVETKAAGSYCGNMSFKVEEDTETDNENVLYVLKVFFETIELESARTYGDTVINAFESNKLLTLNITDNSLTNEDLLEKLKGEHNLTSTSSDAYTYPSLIKTAGDLDKYKITDSDPLFAFASYWFGTLDARPFVFMPVQIDTDNDKAPKWESESLVKHLDLCKDLFGIANYCVFGADNTASEDSTQAFHKWCEDNDITYLSSTTKNSTSDAKNEIDNVNSEQLVFPPKVMLKDEMGTPLGALFSSYYALAGIYATKSPATSFVENRLSHVLPNLTLVQNDGTTPSTMTETGLANAIARGLVTLYSTDDGIEVYNLKKQISALVPNVDYTTETGVFSDDPTKVQTKIVLQGVAVGTKIKVQISSTSDCAWIAESAIDGHSDIVCRLVRIKPYSLNLCALLIDIYSDYDKDHPNDNLIFSYKFMLNKGTTNQGLTKAINSFTGSYLKLQLNESAYNPKDTDIVTRLRYMALTSQELDMPILIEDGDFKVSLEDYINAYKKFEDERYSGSFISELTAPVTDDSGNLVDLDYASGNASNPTGVDSNNYVESPRRQIHYELKQIAASRKDLTCIFSTPKGLDCDEACYWTNSLDKFSDLWEYGQSNAIAYEDQSFYCEMYWGWLRMKCVKIENGTATGSKKVDIAPSIFVIQNGLNSYRTRGVFYPVAGENGGLLSDGLEVITNPASKLERDKLIQYRINPIFDYGVRGIQIYGNETLNPIYSDLSAAHIARMIIQIRSKVHNITESFKFRLNDSKMWSQWINRVTAQVLSPLYSAGGIAYYTVDMGYNTTTREDLAQRKVRGQIQIQAYPDAEIFDLEFDVLASSEEFESQT